MANTNTGVGQQSRRASIAAMRNEAEQLRLSLGILLVYLLKELLIFQLLS